MNIINFYNYYDAGKVQKQIPIKKYSDVLPILSVEKVIENPQLSKNFLNECAMSAIRIHTPTLITINTNI